MPKNYPKKLFVQHFKDDRDDYFSAYEDAEELGDGKVAIYELKEMKEKRTEIHLE